MENFSQTNSSYCQARRMLAIRSILLRLSITFSAISFAVGRRGVIRLWVFVECFIYVEIWFLLNAGPSSDIILCGIPCSENNFSSAEIVQLADIDHTISTMRQRDCWSIATNRYFEFGSRPRKSMFIVCHGYGGTVYGSNG